MSSSTHNDKATESSGSSADTASTDVSYGRIGRMSLPMVLSQAVGMASQLAAIGLIGRMDGGALYVRSVYTPVAFVFLALTTGLAVTLQVAVAQACGRGERREISAYLGSVARAGVVLFVLLGGALTLLSGVLGDAVEITAERRGVFQAFLAAMAVAVLLGMLGELCSGVLRGAGRPGISAALTGIFVSLNLGIIVVGALVMDGGLMTVPLAAGVAGVVEIVVGVTALVRTGLISPRLLTRWEPATGGMLLHIGLPVSLSSVVLAVVNLLLLRIVAPAGEAAVAGFNVGYTLQTASVVPAIGLGSAISVLMNHHIAAGSPQASRTVFRRGMALAAGGYAVVTAILLLAGGPLVTLMSGDPAVAAEARHFIAIVGPTFACTGIMLVTLTVLEQVGHGLLAVLLNVGYFGAILGVGWYIVGSGTDMTPLYWTMAVAAAASLVAGFPLSARAALRPVVLDGGSR